MEHFLRGLTLCLALGLLFIGLEGRPKRPSQERPEPQTAPPASCPAGLTPEKVNAQLSVARTDLLHYGKPLHALIAGPIRKPWISLRVEKSHYRLTVLYQNEEIKSYPIVMGFNPVDDKRQEGDGCTPEGKFALQALYPHRAWSKFMWLNYPTSESWRRFYAARQQGRIPPNATIGGQIGIHGVPDKADYAIDACRNWTLGCISLKTKDINEIYAVCRTGTPVTILH